MTMIRAFPRTAVAGGLMMFLTCCGPRGYPPTCDVSPVLIIPLPAHIRSLARCQRTETYALHGKSVKDGSTWCDDIKEFFYDKQKGDGKFPGDIDYTFHVFFARSSAVEYYNREKRFISQVTPVHHAGGDLKSA